MGWKAPNRYLGRCATIVLVVLGMSASAQAQDVDYHHLLAVAEEQGLVTQRMAAEALLATLEIDRDINLVRLKSSRNQFDRVLRGLRDGDPQLQLPPVSEPELLGHIDQARQIWISMRSAIDDCIAGDVMTAEHIGAIAEGSLDLQDVVEDLADGIRTRSMVGESHSMLRVAVDTASHARTMSQQMTKEFLLVAIGHQTGRNRYAVRDSAEQFEADLRGLLEGDYDRLLLAAPTPAIRAQLGRIEEIWRGAYRPLIERALTEDLLDEGAIGQMMPASQQLFGELDSVVDLYHQL